jgi:hypothetical protein
VFDHPPAPLRKRDDPFGRPADRVAEDWCGADHAVIGNDQVGDEVWSYDPYLLWLITARIGIHRLIAAGNGSVDGGAGGFGGRGFGFDVIDLWPLVDLAGAAGSG